MRVKLVSFVWLLTKKSHTIEKENERGREMMDGTHGREKKGSKV